VAFRVSELLSGQTANMNLARAFECNSDNPDRLTAGFTDTIKKHPEIRVCSFYEEKETRALIVLGHESSSPLRQ